MFWFCFPVTIRALSRAGLNVPAQHLTGNAEDNATFLAEHNSLMIKPMDDEQNQNITINLRTPSEVQKTIEQAHIFNQRVLLKNYHESFDLHILMIGYKMVTAAIRRPAEIIGDGQHNIDELINTQNRRRQTATDNESRIPKT